MYSNVRSTSRGRMQPSVDWQIARLSQTQHSNVRSKSRGWMQPSVDWQIVRLSQTQQLKKLKWLESCTYYLIIYIYMFITYIYMFIIYMYIYIFIINSSVYLCYLMSVVQKHIQLLSAIGLSVVWNSGDSPLHDNSLILGRSCASKLPAQTTI